MEQTTAARSAAVADVEALAPNSAIRVEVAAHAPHSISRELFALLIKSGGIRSIHVAESKSEDEFVKHGGGEWREFLDRRVGQEVSAIQAASLTQVLAPVVKRPIA